MAGKDWKQTCLGLPDEFDLEQENEVLDLSAC
jgi:hypothetical protein